MNTNYIDNDNELINYNDTFNYLNEEVIKDYDELDIQIIHCLSDVHETYNIMDILIENINFKKITEDDYNYLLKDISYYNIQNIVKIMYKNK